ncbi:hypothetical protein [Sorangium sp. So ce861]|uniref:hypothetical protein n=1 Tax=Sorangium sp. So ce861 TaxID=3133323 RepID=UPI003F60E420
MEIVVDRCIRCGGELEKGFILDKDDSGIGSQADWASGDPNTSFWRFSAVQSGNRILPIVSYRCVSCGRLESFAHAAD